MAARPRTGLCKPLSGLINNLMLWDSNLLPEPGMSIPPTDSHATDLALTGADLHALIWHPDVLGGVPNSASFTLVSRAAIDMDRAATAALVITRWWRVIVETAYPSDPHARMMKDFGEMLRCWDIGILGEFGSTTAIVTPAAHDLSLTGADLHTLMGNILAGVPNTTTLLTDHYLSDSLDWDRAMFAALLVGRWLRMLAKANGEF